MYFVRFVCLLSVLCFVTGCGSRRVSTSNSTQADKKEATSEDVLASAIYQLRPQNFGFNASTDKPVSLLNSWRFKRAEEGQFSDQAESIKAPADWVASSELERLAQSKFDLQDSFYVRDSILYHAISGHVADRGRDEIQQVGRIIDFVCRNVVFWRDDQTPLPMTPYLALEFGRGTAEDRASVCAEILRQLKVDTVIVRAKSDAKESTDKWLFGVVIAGKIYLYDLTLGVPVANGATYDGAPAVSLDQLIQHPEFLELMVADSSYRLTIDELKDPEIYVAFNSNALCRRMQSLEQALPTTDACRLYDPLMDDTGKSGSIERIAAAAGRSPDQLKPWNYPQRQFELMSHIGESPEISQQLQNLGTPLQVPIPFQVDKRAENAANPNEKKEPKFIFGTPERKLERIRIDHLLGKFTEVTQRYLGIRHLEVEPNPPQLEQINRLAADDAFFWVSICKMETEDYQGASDLFASYLKKYDRKGKWYFAARTLLARSQAKLGQTDDAIRTLERKSSDDPNREENALRLKRWKASVQK